MFKNHKAGLCWQVMAVVIRVMVAEGEATMDLWIIVHVNVL